MAELCSRGNRQELMSSVNKWGDRSWTEAGREEDNERKTKIIAFRQTQIIQQKMMNAKDKYSG